MSSTKQEGAIYGISKGPHVRRGAPVQLERGFWTRRKASTAEMPFLGMFRLLRHYASAVAQLNVAEALMALTKVDPYIV